MSFLIYFAVLLFAGASALFGLDVLTAPLPPKHHPRPPVEQAATVPDGKVNKLGREMAAREDANKAKADNAKNESALSPVYPTNPGAAKSEVREVYPPSNPELSAVVAQKNQDNKDKPAGNTAQPQEQAQAQATTPPPQPQQTATTQPVPYLPRETTGTALAEPTPAQQQASAPETTTQAAAQPVAQQTSNKCNVQACASAYQSFSSADCTYQPFEGPRRLCTKSETSQRVASQPAQDQQRSEPRQYSRQYSTDSQRQEQRQDRAQNTDGGLRDAVRRVKSMRNWNADDGDDDAPVVAGRGSRRYIVVPADGSDDW